MISYSRDSQETIPTSAVKIVGLGGAGANMLERIALDGLEGAELLALNTDVRTLGACLAKEKVQLGANLTKGLGTGGDPELGQQAMLEAETAVREALKGQSIVFLCAGLGGGTGSGAAPMVSRIAREEGAFVVVFATMPFFFEGRRRREQAETALNQLAVLSNALVTFDNDRMGELVLAKQGIHEAFSAADRMISESIKAVIRLVVRPGLINVGLDDLMSALRTTRSRCLFGSGIADGKDRASKALRNALSSPLLDQGSLLNEAQTILVHLSGGESLTLFEIELLMRSLQKHVPESAHVLFGAAIDPGMGDNLSVTLISALPEDTLEAGARNSPSFSETKAEPLAEAATKPNIENPFRQIDREAEPQAEKAPEPKTISDPEHKEQRAEDSTGVEAAVKPKKNSIPEPQSKLSLSIGGDLTSLFGDLSADSPEEETTEERTTSPEPEEEEMEERPFAEFVSKSDSPEETEDMETEEEPPVETKENHPSRSMFTSLTAPKDRSGKKPLWGKSESPTKTEPDETHPSGDEEPAKESESPAKPEGPELKLGSKYGGGQSELSFDSAPRGRFEGENPNVVDGEDLDLPPFLRKKKS
jgi:cell division protein FtsZ